MCTGELEPGFPVMIEDRQVPSIFGMAALAIIAIAPEVAVFQAMATDTRGGLEGVLFTGMTAGAGNGSMLSQQRKIRGCVIELPAIPPGAGLVATAAITSQ